MSYSIKEIYFTLQGEGFQTGKEAVFCRFSGCNLWTGREEDRNKATCTFCDTDFFGIDGENGAKYASCHDLIKTIEECWPKELDEKFIVSENAWRLSSAGYSSMFIMVGDEVTVENLLKGIIVASGNDACVALAEGIAGTEEEFAMLMTEKAIEIGMENTNFANSSGINSPDNLSTVRDIMIMSKYLIKNYLVYSSSSSVSIPRASLI